MCYCLMYLKILVGKRWHVKLVTLRTVYKDGNGVVARDIGAPVPPWGLQGQEKRVLTRTRDRAVWRGLVDRRDAGGKLEE